MEKMEERSSEAGWSARSILTCIGMAAFTGLIVLAMKMISPAESAPAPQEIAPLVPHSPLIFAVYDVHRRAAADDPILRELGKLRVDYLMLQEIGADQVAAAARATGMPLPQRPELYQPSANVGGPNAAWGDCILSRHVLIEPSPLATPEGTFGVWARSEIDGASFQVASVSPAGGMRGDAEFNAVREAWRRLSAPSKGSSRPIVIGGRFAAPPIGDTLVDRSTGWYDGVDAFAFITPTTSPASSAAAGGRLLFSTGWSCTSGRRVADPAGGTAWVITASGQAPASTRPTTQDANE